MNHTNNPTQSLYCTESLLLSYNTRGTHTSWYGGSGGAGNADGTDGRHAARGALFRRTGLVSSFDSSQWGGDVNFPVFVFQDTNQNGLPDPAAGEAVSVAYLSDAGGDVKGSKYGGKTRVDLSHNVADHMGMVSTGRVENLSYLRIADAPSVNRDLTRTEASELDTILTTLNTALESGANIDTALTTLQEFQQRLQ